MYDETGKKVSEYYSKGRLDERNKLEGKISKITNAITKALDKGDFGDVYNLANEKQDRGEDNPATPRIAA